MKAYERVQEFNMAMFETSEVFDYLANSIDLYTV